MLRRLGLRTVGRFAALAGPGRAGAVRRARDAAAPVGLRGRGRAARGGSAAPVDLRVSTAVDPPADRVDRAAFVAKSLADTLHAELAAKGLACTRVLVVAETEVGDRIERLWRHEGALSAAAIAQRVRWQLEGWLGTGRSLGGARGGVQPPGAGARPGRARRRGATGVLGRHERGGRAGGAGARPRAGAGGRRRGAGAGVARWTVAGGAVPAGALRRGGPVGPRPARRSTVAGACPRPGAGGGVARRPAVEVVDAEGRRVGVGGRGLISAAPARCRRGGCASTTAASTGWTRSGPGPVRGASTNGGGMHWRIVAVHGSRWCWVRPMRGRPGRRARGHPSEGARTC